MDTIYYDPMTCTYCTVSDDEPSQSLFRDSIDPFPPVDPAWFQGGLPDSINTSGPGLTGNPIDYIPVDVISKTFHSGSINFSLNPANLDKFDGYIDQGGTYHPYVPAKFPVQNVAPGVRMCTLFYKKDTYDWLKGCTVRGKGKWVLLSDFGGIEPGSTATKSISYKQGVTTTNAESLAFTVGMKVGASGEGLSAELSASLTATFSSSVSITDETTVTDTVSFQAQDREQRIGAYQFYRNYFVEPSDVFTQFSNNQQNDARQPAYNTINRTFDYKTNHFQKVFVLAPDTNTKI